MGMAAWGRRAVRQAGASLHDGWRRLWPSRCCLCGQAGEGALDLCRFCLALAWRNAHPCARCAMPLPPTERPGTCCADCLVRPGPLAAVHAAWLYAAPLDALVRRCKFAADLAAGRTLARLMLQERPAWLAPGAVLVPVPLHRQRLRERGFDQARELVHQLAAGTGLPWWAGLQRNRPTRAQSSLPLEERRRNLARAFVAAGPVPARVVLVDDVMTTGATLEAAARALQAAGVEEVRAWVAVRTP